MTSTAEPPLKLPSVLFAIPLPKPAQASVNKDTLPFALYTFPRATYEKPIKDPLTGKKPKEKLVKKLERKWQHEVEEGKDIKKGVIKDAGPWKKFKGSVINAAASVIQWMPSNVIEALTRLPPIKKLGKVSVYYPHRTDIPPYFNLPELSEQKIDRGFFNLLMDAKKKAKKRTILSGCLLPVTLAIDILVIIPLFMFEINLAYFTMQFSGSKKATSFADTQKKLNSTKLKVQGAEDAMCEFNPVDATLLRRPIEHVYGICSSIDPVKFPPNHSLPQPSYVANKDIATGLIQIFTQSVPAHVAARHVLDEDLAAADLDRSLRKAAKEYIKTLS